MGTGDDSVVGCTQNLPAQGEYRRNHQEGIATKSASAIVGARIKKSRDLVCIANAIWHVHKLPVADYARNRMHKFASVAEKAAQVYAALAACIFFVSGVVYLCLGHWPVTHLDYWGMYGFALNHTWLESSLLKHGGHTLFFPSFLWLADLRFFRGDQQLLFIAGLTLLFVTTTLLLVPVWRDRTVGLTAKIISVLVVIVGNFWMARSGITASGGFNCICSLVMTGAATTFLLLPKMCASSRRLFSATLIIVCGFVASFSFGAGLAIWPTLLVLAWCLRLPISSVVLLALAGLAVATVFVLIPPHHLRFQIAPDVAFLWFCRLLGSPVSYAVFSWWPDTLFRHLIESSGLALYAGMVGLVLAALAVLPQIVRRNVQRSSLEFTGLALTVFTLFTFALLVVGRADYFYVNRLVEFPRYLFWSTLFWTGLLLVAVQRAESKQWLRWPVWLLALAVPVLVFPRHYKNGLGLRWAMTSAQYGATSLINGVRDEEMVKMVFGHVELGYRVAEQFRTRRLDMFADGLQDWIGLEEENLFGGGHKPEKLKGQCAVTALVHCDNGAPAARVVGQASSHGGSVPKTLVIVDPTGVVRGVARSSPTSRFINRAFYLGKVQRNEFLGYIRDYNPQLHYAVRSADDRTLSEETIPVQVGTTNPAKP